MSGRKILTYFTVALALVILGCNEEEEGSSSKGGFDVQFVVPAGVETLTDYITFEVIDGKAPLLTDSFIFELASSGGGNISYSYPCTITEVSSESFTVELSESLSSGQWNVYLRRGSETKSYGSLYLALVRVGEVLPNWFEGELDIHMISTGRGDNTYNILPDGTTFLVDAGDTVTPSGGGGPAPFMPNDEITAGQVIVDYINHFAPTISAGHLNYFLATHHHGDHIGSYSTSRPNHSSGLFRVNGVTEVGSKLIMDKIFDRDWPDFNYPTASSGTGNLMTNYIAFLNWTIDTNKSVVEKWRVGTKSQLVPVNSKSWDVSVRSYAGNAYFWTGGADEDVFTLMPDDFSTVSDDDFPDENCFSCAFILTYGKFDYFNGGDLQHAYAGDQTETIPQPFWDCESPIVPAVHKVEVMEANHHGCTGTHKEELINVLAPDVWLVGTWNETGQPNRHPTARVLAANPDVEVFSVYQSDANLEVCARDVGMEEVEKHFMNRSGHIVVRVAPGGDSYMVYTLDDTDQEYRVTSIHGPYLCGD